VRNQLHYIKNKYKTFANAFNTDLKYQYQYLNHESDKVVSSRVVFLHAKNKITEFFLLTHKH